MSEPTIIDTVLAAAAQTVVSDLEPVAHTALEDLHAFVTGQADRLRTALPALAQAAADHVHSMATATLAEFESVLGRIEAHLGGGVSAVAPSVPSVSVDPTIPVPTTPISSSESPSSETPQSTTPVSDTSSPESSTSSATTTPAADAIPAEPVTGMAPPAGEPVAATDTTQAV